MRVTIGCDPEFGFLNTTPETGPVYSADFLRKPYDTDEYSQDMGLLEIRPHYANNVDCLVNNIRKTLTHMYVEQNLKSKSNILFHAGSITKNGGIIGSRSYNVPMGGHIHFGVKPPDMNIFYLPSILMLYVESYNENRKRRVNRSFSSYGRLDGFRHQDWGFEYRAPASWLHSPEMASAVLGLYHSVVRANCERRLPKLYHKLISKLYFNNDTTLANYRTCNRKHFKPILPEIITALTRLPDYKSGVYKPNIDYLLDHIKTKRGWSERQDIFASWGIKKVPKNA
jgi:hypothetical protein